MSAPYYQDDAVTLYHGDALEILPTLQADLVITSPPYNRGARIDGAWEGVTTASCKSSRFREGYGANTDDLPWSEYQEWLRTVNRAMWRAVGPNGAMWINHKPRVVNGRLWMPTETLEGLPLRQVVIWQTGVGVNLMPGALAPAHEWIMLVAPAQWRLRNRTASAQGDVWSMVPSRNDDHPAPFPLGLPSRCIEASPPGVVIDPFAGTGTTLRAAKNYGCIAVGIELEERYCEIAARRCAQESLPA